MAKIAAKSVRTISLIGLTASDARGNVVHGEVRVFEFVLCGTFTGPDKSGMLN